LDGIIVSWNRGAQKIYGYTEAEAIGKPISMLVPPELPDEENKILDTLKSGLVSSILKRFAFPNG